MSDYVLGNGNMSVSMGTFTKLELPYIRIANIEAGKKIGENLLEQEVKETEIVTILVKNLEGLAVLEKAVKMAKAKLKETNKRTGL